jgi:hypothetical protein
MVPSLLIDQEALSDDVEAHVGTLDLDLGLSLAISDEASTSAVAACLRAADFESDLRPENGARQTWTWKANEAVTVDLLVPHRPEDENARKLRDFGELSAFVTPGLDLAFLDRERVSLEGQTILGKRASATLNVCGPGAFVALKAQAMRRRADNKDTYDLYYLLRNYGNGPEDVARRYVPLLNRPRALEALDFIREDLGSVQSIGAERLAMFLSNGTNHYLQAEVFALAKSFLEVVDRLRGEER